MKKYGLIIDGKLDGLNEYINQCRVNQYAGNACKHRNQSRCELSIRHYLRGVKIKAPIKISYAFYEPNRRRDIDNVAGLAHKVFQDALVTCGVIHDDGWNYVRGFNDSFYVDRKWPRIEIEIEECK